MTRLQALRAAHHFIDSLETAPFRLTVVAPASGTIVPLARVLRLHLANRVADVLQQGRAPSRLERARRIALGWSWSEVSRVRETAERLKRRRTPQPEGGQAAVLAIPRTANHLRDMLPVEPIARERGLDFAWLVFKREHEALLSGKARLICAGQRAPARRAQAVALALESFKLARGLPRPAQVPEAAWPRALSMLIDETATLTPAVLAAIARIDAALASVSPRVVWVGNPCSFEGAIACVLARARGIRVIGSQHGEIGPTQLEWAHAELDAFAAWGDRSRAALIELGMGAERIFVTGAPWTDALVVTRTRRRDGAILVALSGAGNAVGMPEHLDHVRRLLAASRDVDRRWIFRLHPKDDARIYERLASETPGCRYELSSARDGKSIHEQLSDAAVLVTVTSASALDAMLHRVPVVTLARPDGERTSEFVRAGATTHAATEASLAECIKRVLDAEAREVATQARAYVREFFGDLDGAAGARIVALLSASSRGAIPCP